MKRILLLLTIIAGSIYAFGLMNTLHAEKSRLTKPAKSIIISPPFAFVELYTSEGCNSCPPAYLVAEDLMQQAADNKQRVYLLDFHVDYFNNMGWADPYSSAENTKRQQTYKGLFPEAGIYTPQMIVNGSEQVLGSDAQKAKDAVEKALKTNPDASITITDVLTAKGDAITVHFTTQNIPEYSLVNFALVQKTIVQKVLKGENAHKTLTHHNVVRTLVSIPAKDGEATLTLPNPQANVDLSAYSVIAFEQDPNSLKILAATSKDLNTLASKK